MRSCPSESGLNSLIVKGGDLSPSVEWLTNVYDKRVQDAKQMTPASQIYILDFAPQGLLVVVD
jgi:hypothetical protein